MHFHMEKIITLILNRCQALQVYLAEMQEENHLLLEQLPILYLILLIEAQ